MPKITLMRDRVSDLYRKTVRLHMKNYALKRRKKKVILFFAPYLGRPCD